MEEIFTKIYNRRIWGKHKNNNNNEYKGCSGSGSSIKNNINDYIPFLKNFITENNIKSIVDLGCGDFLCGNLIYNDLNINYTGYDAYKKIINYHSKTYLPSKYSFIHLDFFSNKENIINSDLCILKDVLQHWNLDSIYSFLDYIILHKKFKYILLINCCKQIKDNSNISNGEFHHLSCDYLPLKKYNPKKLLNYKDKEISLIH